MEHLVDREWLVPSSEPRHRDLSWAIADSAGDMFRCQDETQVLDIAVSSLRAAGVRAGFLLGGAEGLRLGPFDRLGELRLDLEEAHGVGFRQVVVSPGTCPLLATILSAAGPIELPEGGVERILLGTASAGTPRGPTWGVRLLVEGNPFGVLLAEGRALVAGGPVVALVGRNVAAALENVRRLGATSKRLHDLSLLQEELVSKERLSALGGAAALVAHEVRNPLGAILNAVALLKRNPQASADDLLGMIEEEALRIDGLVHDLLELARSFEPTVRPVELVSIARDAVEALQRRFEESSVDVEVESSCSRIVAVDPELSRMAVEHLLKNAVDASSAGDRIRVIVGGVADGGGFIRVVDPGVGIPAGERERIFEPFFTTHPRRRGLGLVLVKRIAEAHGGRLEVAGGPEGGTLATLRFPGSAATDES